MKKIALALLLTLLFALPAFAVFSSKGQIPNGDPVQYRGLKVTNDGVNITLLNRGDKAVTFSAACVFIGEKRAEVGDFFIERVTIEPQGDARLEKLFLKGDAKLCRKAESLNWTIYTLEEK